MRHYLLLAEAQTPLTPYNVGPGQRAAEERSTFSIARTTDPIATKGALQLYGSTSGHNSSDQHQSSIYELLHIIFHPFGHYK